MSRCIVVKFAYPNSDEMLLHNSFMQAFFLSAAPTMCSKLYHLFQTTTTTPCREREKSESIMSLVLFGHNGPGIRTTDQAFPIPYRLVKGRLNEALRCLFLMSAYRIYKIVHERTELNSRVMEIFCHISTTTHPSAAGFHIRLFVVVTSDMGYRTIWVCGERM